MMLRNCYQFNLMVISIMLRSRIWNGYFDTPEKAFDAALDEIDEAAGDLDTWRKMNDAAIARLNEKLQAKLGFEFTGIG